MKNVFFITLALLGLMNHSKAYEARLSKEKVVVAQTEIEEATSIFSLENGIKVYLAPHSENSGHGSIRIVLRKSTSDPFVYAFDGAINSFDAVEEFLVSCCNAIRGQISPKIDNTRDFFRSAFSFSPEKSEEIGVVVVGDFSKMHMKDLIQQHFSSLEIGLNEVPEEHIRVSQDSELFKVALRLNYDVPSFSIASENDLIEKWKYYLIHDLFQNRLERCVRHQNEDWIHPYSKFLQPVSGYAVISEEIAENLLSYLLLQVEALRTQGFTEEEFLVAKKNLMFNLQYFSSHVACPDHSFILAYYVDQFLMGVETCEPYETFLMKWQKWAEELQWEELETYCFTFFNQNRKSIQIVYPIYTQAEILTVDEIEILSKRISTLSSFYNANESSEESDSIINTRFIQNEAGSEFYFANNILLEDHLTNHLPGLYYQLAISETEKHLIEAIVNTIAEKNIFQLAFEKRGLEKKGKKVNSVHPLRFIGHIFANPELKRAMRAIRKNSFKWDGFLDGYSKRMKLEYEHNNLFKYVVGFSQAVQANPEEVCNYIRRKDWEGLLIYLM